MAIRRVSHHRISRLECPTRHSTDSMLRNPCGIQGKSQDRRYGVRGPEAVQAAGAKCYLDLRPGCHPPASTTETPTLNPKPLTLNSKPAFQGQREGPGRGWNLGVGFGAESTSPRLLFVCSTDLKPKPYYGGLYNYQHCFGGSLL